ncbi:MAG: hypothetical protein A2Z05_06660, partial [Chloroflexi bacterium RBG_16_60_22]
MDRKMQKVMIIARYFGTRIPGLIKYLPEFGWQPVLLTTDPITLPLPPELAVFNTPYRDSLRLWRRLFRLDARHDVRAQIRDRFGVTSKKSLLDFMMTRCGEIINYPDADKGWRPFGIRLGDELLRRENIDAIISSSSPVSSHIIAQALTARHRVPWVADLRDLWSQNHNYTYSWFRKMLDRRLEIKTLSRADALVTVSRPWADKLKTLHGDRPVYTIANGYDPEDVNDPPRSLAARFTITHTGNLYTGKQDASTFLTALQSLIAEGTINPADVEVRFYGPEQGWLHQEIAQCGLSGVVRQYGWVTRQVALAKQRESQVLLAINWETEEGLVGNQGKLFEYLAAQRPILVTGGGGNYMCRELLDETRAGCHAPTVEEVRDSLAAYYREYRRRGCVGFQGNSARIDRHSYREKAREMA